MLFACSFSRSVYYFYEEGRFPLPFVHQSTHQAVLNNYLPLKTSKFTIKTTFSKISHPLPSELTTRRQVGTIFEEQQQRIKQILAKTPVFMSVDESEA